MPPILDLPEGPVRSKTSLSRLKCTIPKIRAITELEKCLTKQRHSCANEAFTARMKLMEAGYRPLGSGIHRVGFAKRGEKCVIKLAKNRKGAIANMNEMKVWHDVSTSDAAKFFAPILKHGTNGSFVVMPKVKIGSGISYEKRVKLNNAMERNGLYCTDLNRGNVGLDEKGNPVIIDYGFGLNCSRHEAGIMPGDYEDEYPSRPSGGFPSG